MDIKKLLLTSLPVLLCCLGIYYWGYSNGKSSVIPKTEIQYIIGPSIQGSLTKLEPIKVDIPSIPWLIQWRDTVYNTDTTFLVNEVDSLAILQDYLTKREYNISIFDIDTIGTCSINAITYRNRLDVLSYTFSPVNKIYNKFYKQSDFDIFGGIGVNTGNEFNAQFGFFKGNLGMSYQYTRNWELKDNFHGINAFYKFNVK